LSGIGDIDAAAIGVVNVSARESPNPITPPREFRRQFGSQLSTAAENRNPVVVHVLHYAGGRTIAGTYKHSSSQLFQKGIDSAVFPPL
jgi:hypothetical protein